ncbi:MAG: hypothetical protein IKE66_01760 [Hyphomicrobium sp.]|nr:hypothetical protein [Hyphomicrobium sp.]
MYRLLKPSGQIVIALALTLAAVFVTQLHANAPSGTSPPAPRIEAWR